MEPGTSGSAYSPHRRTAVIFCGTGAHGAYHAGVLRALQEAGVRIDIACGHSVGAATAMLAAIDGAGRLWDDGGVWRSRAPSRFYGWKPLILSTGWIAALLIVVLLSPVLALAGGMLVLAAGFLVTLVGLTNAGAELNRTASTALQLALAPENLPTIVPRLAMVVVAALVVAASAGVFIAQWRAPLRRQSQGAWWWRLIGAPLEATTIRTAFASAIGELIRGATAAHRSEPGGVGRRYAEALAENLGQPGFRELVLVVTDVDARRDLVAALVSEPFRREFLTPRVGRDRRAEVLDLTGPDRDHALDVLASALTPPLVCDPALIKFSGDSLWRGETHRFCDRPDAVYRLIEEAAMAGAAQAIIVSAVAPRTGAHTLRPPRLDLKNRFGDFMMASEAAAIRDAIETARLGFDSVYVIRPAHNPVGPFDFEGAYDEASDRKVVLAELIDEGYVDAYRQFIDPIVGASGEALGRIGVTAPANE